MPRQAEVSGADPFRGKLVGKYEILTRMSVGGMAELFLAFTTGPGGFRKFVALKQILPDVKTEEFVRMFLDEARITAAFSHPNIGQVFDLGEEDGELYLAMEFLPGQNLEQIMTAASLGEPLPIGFAARVVRDVCLGLHYAHHFTAPSGKRVEVVHRDLTPRNVMVSYDGVVKVIDFGIAKAKGRLNRTQVGMVKGTSGYMSPEQVRNHDLDGRSDLFCAGVVLHELLCGLRLYDTSDEDAMMRAIAHSDVASPRSINPNVPEALDAVVMRALSRDPARRFSTGREMAKAIDQAMGQELFDEESMAGLMQSLFAEKRQKTLALLNAASHDSEEVSQIAIVLQQKEPPAPPPAPPRKRPTFDDESDIGATLPQPALSFEEERPARPAPAMPRPLAGAARPPRRSSVSSEPPQGAGRPRALSGRVVGEPPSRKPAAPPGDEEATQVSPPESPKQGRAAAPDPEAGSRRPAKMGVFTLGPAAPPPGARPQEREDSEVSEVSEVSRVSRVSRALTALDQPSRRGLWILLGIVILAGLGVLFMPEALRSRLGSLFSSAGSTPGAMPPAVGIPTDEPQIPAADEYEPPPPGEGGAEPQQAAPAPTTPTAPVPRPRKPEAATPTEAAAKPALAPRRPATGSPAKPAVPGQKPVKAAEEGAEEGTEEPSVGPAEVDPSIQPLELSPPEEAQ